MKTKRFALFALALVFLGWSRAPEVTAQPYVYLTEVPDYQWHAGCFGTASGNLAGFWDRHGLPDFYTGPTDDGVAPLDDFGKLGIRSMWASQQGLDGRPSNQPGHMDDYWLSYESSGQDPYVTAGRPEHAPDCIGDFIGLSQRKWTDGLELAGECNGNIDAYSFVFWDKTGNRRLNYYTTNTMGEYVPDVASGLKEWARYRGYDADVFTQLTDFNPERTGGTGFTYDDVKAEIDAGYPVLCFLQPGNELSRPIGSLPAANPPIHGVMIFGYFSDSFSGIDKGVVIKTSWGQGTSQQSWRNLSWLGLFPVRGVIGFRPKPKIRAFTREGGNIHLAWDGPSAELYDEINGTTTPCHRYVVQRATRISPPDWKSITTPSTERSATVAETAGDTVFYRVVIQN